MEAASGNSIIPAMPSPRPAARTPDARRLARRAWALLQQDSKQSLALAESALSHAGGDDAARAAALLARGFHRLYFATPAEASQDLEAAHALALARGDRASQILAAAGLARGLWRSGRFREAMERVLPLRDEGLKVLRHDRRGVLLNTIAGAYSALGHSDRAFAYMYEALRETGPGRGNGFETVLHCNISHELLQLGDCHEALRHIESGLSRKLANLRLESVLLINRVLSLTDLDRPAEALADIERIRTIPANPDGRGPMASHFETLAICALRAGEVELGAELVAAAHAAPHAAIPDEHVEIAVADALLGLARGDTGRALAALDQARLYVDPPADGLSPRAQGLWLQTLSEVHEARGDATAALAAMRLWRGVQMRRAELASQARYQAAALQTELLRLQHRLDEQDARQREIEAMNRQLSRRVAEVQALQARLRDQATRDELTGLFNRRHLNETLPSMLALAQRDHHPLAVAIIDLDHFKSVNDRHGHGAGDRLLAAFGALLAGSVRKSDVACRYGGEEFCLLMPRTDAAYAKRKIGALLRKWREMHFDMSGGELSGFTFSAGIADSLRSAGPVPALLKAADDELLAAKQQGRNRVRAAE